VIQYLPQLCVVLCVVIAAVGAWTDYRTRQIPNWLTFGGIGLGVALQALLGHRGIEMAQFGGETAIGGIVHALLGAVVCGLPLWVLFRKEIEREDGTMDTVSGGGDVKILAAMGALLGLYYGLELEFLCLAATSVLTLARLAWHGRLLRVLSNALFLALNPILPKKWRRRITAELLHKVRLGVPILLGTVMFAVHRLAR
jgi:Flp pilus assembly protein protease CpaA